MIAILGPGLLPVAASVAQPADPPGVAELRVQAGVLLDRLEEIEAELAAAATDVALARQLSAELEGLLEQLRLSIEARAAEATRRSLRQLPLVRSAILPRFVNPVIVTVAADPEGLGAVDPADRRSWTNVRDERADSVRSRRTEQAAAGQLSDLSSELRSASPGTIILLEPGRHSLIDLWTLRTGMASDVAIIGPGPDACTIHVDRSGELPAGVRLLIAGAAVDLNSTPLCDIRSGSLTVRDVAVSGYNSGAGGSNAIFMMGPGMLVLESVRMDGGPGRAADGVRGGDAMDVRGDVTVHARQVRFRNHGEIGRFEGTTVLDRCISINAAGMRQSFAFDYADGTLVTRASNVPTRRFDGVGTTGTLAASVDDARLIRLAAGAAADDATIVAGREDDPRPELDVARSLVDQLSLDRRPGYWISLLVDPRPDVRALAADRVRSLLGPIGLPEELLAPPKVPGAAEVDARLPGLLVHGRVAQWWAANRRAFAWDEASGGFVRRAD